MATIIDMPKVSDTMTTGTLVRWLKKEGDSVANGDMIAEIETDKATMEVECFEDGILLKSYCSEGDEVAVGDPIAAIGEAGETAPEGNRSTTPNTQKDKEEKPEKEEKADELPEKPDNEPSHEQESSETTHRQEKRIKASPLAKANSAALWIVRIQVKFRWLRKRRSSVPIASVKKSAKVAWALFTLPNKSNRCNGKSQ